MLSVSHWLILLVNNGFSLLETFTRNIIFAISTHVDENTHVLTPLHTNKYTPVRVCKHAWTHTCTHAHTCTHTNADNNICTRKHERQWTCKHVHTRGNTTAPYKYFRNRNQNENIAEITESTETQSLLFLLHMSWQRLSNLILAASKLKAYVKRSRKGAPRTKS